MDSPTMEISQGLEALRIAGSKERLDMAANTSLDERLSMEEQLGQYKATSSANSEIKDERIVAQSENCGLSQFSKTPLEEDRHWRSFGPELSGRSEEYQWRSHQHQRHFRNHYRHHSKAYNHKSITTATHPKPEKPDEGDTSSVIDSFGTLCVSNVSTCSSVPPVNHTVNHHASVAMPRSCRAEARSSAMCLDDTTVDDLAGYLDEIMFLPKPMSEMAELMYT